MGTQTTTDTIQVTLVHPDGSIRLMVPIDLPLAELMPDFLEVARQPDHDGWDLGPAAGQPYQDRQKTLSELGLGEGDVLVLHDPAPTAPMVKGPAPKPKPQRSATGSSRPAAAER